MFSPGDSLVVSRLLRFGGSTWGPHDWVFNLVVAEHLWTKDLKRTVFVGRDSMLWVFSTFESVICHNLSLFPNIFRDVCTNPGFETSWSHDISPRVFTYHLERHESHRIEVERSSGPSDGCRVPQPQATPEGARPSPEDLAVKKRL